MKKSKGINKCKVGFSLSIDVDNELQKYCSDNLINKSKLVDKIIKDYLILNNKKIYDKSNGN